MVYAEAEILLFQHAFSHAHANERTLCVIGSLVLVPLRAAFWTAGQDITVQLSAFVEQGNPLNTLGGHPF